MWESRLVNDVRGIYSQLKAHFLARAEYSTFRITGFLSLTDKRSSVTTSSCENDSSARRMPHIVSDDSVDVPLATTKSSGIIRNNLIFSFRVPSKNRTNISLSYFRSVYLRTVAANSQSLRPENHRTADYYSILVVQPLLAHAVNGS